MSNLLVKKLTSNATLPQRATDGSAGYDLFSAYDYTVKGRTRSLIKTDLAITVPEDTYGRVAARSGLSMKGVDVGAGVIDRDYGGNVHVLLINNSDDDLLVKNGDRVAQLILERIVTPPVQEVQEIQETDHKGFGSTGR